MKKFATLFFCLALTLAARSQTTQEPVTVQNYAPITFCSYPVPLVKVTAGTDSGLYQCDPLTNTWFKYPKAAGLGTVTSFAAPSGSWPTWLVPVVTNPTTTPSLAVTAGQIPIGNLGSAGLSGSSPVVVDTTGAVSIGAQTANLLLAGPVSGGSAAPAFRALVNADFPGTLAPTFSAANLTNVPPVSSANNIAGGATGSAPYQSAAATTTFIASPTTSGHTFVYAWQPSGSAIAPTAVDLGVPTGTGGVVLATSPTLTTANLINPTLNVASATTVTSNAVSGTGTASFVVGAGAGSSPGTPTCFTSHVCDSSSGVIALTTGSSTVAGIVLTITLGGVTRTNIPNCLVNAFVNATGAVTQAVEGGASSTTALSLFTNVAVPSSTAMLFTYTCQGK